MDLAGVVIAVPSASLGDPHWRHATVLQKALEGAGVASWLFCPTAGREAMEGTLRPFLEVVPEEAQVLVVAPLAWTWERADAGHFDPLAADGSPAAERAFCVGPWGWDPGVPVAKVQPPYDWSVDYKLAALLGGLAGRGWDLSRPAVTLPECSLRDGWASTGCRCKFQCSLKGQVSPSDCLTCSDVVP